MYNCIYYVLCNMIACSSPCFWMLAPRTKKYTVDLQVIKSMVGLHFGHDHPQNY